MTIEIPINPITVLLFAAPFLVYIGWKADAWLTKMGL
jgi:hypothetical protein